MISLYDHRETQERNLRNVRGNHKNFKILIELWRIDKCSPFFTRTNLVLGCSETLVTNCLYPLSGGRDCDNVHSVQCTSIARRQERKDAAPLAEPSFNDFLLLVKRMDSVKAKRETKNLRLSSEAQVMY
ncbi:hypothetical protein CEXT_15491 [Caerostris extrusa]|uniref:Uncharacterized protein n=1 Tax=Caerostris extrusa TaxID=172846 RepID=A0AAV4WBE0_CAEEX|nr:hypothetical protein CEXT_15491 [Caerostris extrusa]